MSNSPKGSVPGPVWTSLIAPDEWQVYEAALNAMDAAGVRTMLGGAFGLATYTGRWRNTKDMDLFLHPRDRERAIQALTGAGFSDFYERLAYDRGWIYRGVRADVIVDLIWGTPNRRTEVDDLWFEHAGRVRLRDRLLLALPAEELAWIKLYVLQRDRCDWPDVINLLDATSANLDWKRLVERLADDLPLLQGLISVFLWLNPERAEDIPRSLRFAAIKQDATPSPGAKQARINLLDTRPWFAALQPMEKPMPRF